MSDDQSPIPRAYTEEEAAAMLSELGWGVSTRTLRKMRLAGEIDYYVWGKRGIRYTLQQLLAAIERSTVRQD